MQVGTHVCTGLVAQAPVLLHGFRDYSLQLYRGLWVQTDRSHRFPAEDRLQNLPRGIAREGLRSRDHLVQDRPERVEVRPRVQLLSAAPAPETCTPPSPSLSRHPSAAPARLAVGSSGSTLVFDTVRLASPKSSSFAWPRAVTKIFAGLMSLWTIPFAWAASSASTSSRPQLQHPLHLHRLAADQVLQGLALHQLHDDEGVSLVLADLVDHADVGMVERGGGTSLALEPLQSLVALGQLLGQELEATCRSRLRSSAS